MVMACAIDASGYSTQSATATATATAPAHLHMSLTNPIHGSTLNGACLGPLNHSVGHVLVLKLRTSQTTQVQYMLSQTKQNHMILGQTARPASEMRDIRLKDTILRDGSDMECHLFRTRPRTSIKACKAPRALLMLLKCCGTHNGVTAPRYAVPNGLTQTCCSADQHEGIMG